MEDKNLFWKFLLATTVGTVIGGLTLYTIERNDDKISRVAKSGLSRIGINVDKTKEVYSQLQREDIGKLVHEEVRSAYQDLENSVLNKVQSILQKYFPTE